jgi:phage-related protein (TIGR01555 family)
MTQKSAAGMVSETNVDVVRVKGLMQYLSTPEGENKLRDRFSLAKQLKAFNNMMLLDTEEELTHNTNTFAGLPELFDRFSEIVSGASDIPVTRLMGRSPAGLTATGESDLRNYYDMISSKQDAQLRENLEYLDQIVAANIGLSSENLDFTFNPLWQMSELDQSTVDHNNAQRDQIYLMNNVVSEEIVAKQLMNQDTYVALDDEFINKLESEQGEDDFSEESLNKIKAIINGTGNTANNQPTNKPE